MAKTTKYTAEVSEGRDELLDGKTIARLRTIAVKNQRGETVRELKAADNDEDVRAKLRDAGARMRDLARRGGTAARGEARRGNRSGSGVGSMKGKPATKPSARTR